MPFLVKLSPEFSSSLLEEAKATLALSLFLLAAEEKAIIVHLTVQIRLDNSVLTASLGPTNLTPKSKSIFHSECLLQKGAGRPSQQRGPIQKYSKTCQ